MFIQVDTVIKDSNEDLFVIRTSHVKVEEIKDFRPWHRGRLSGNYQGIEGDLTVIYFERQAEDEMDPKKWFVIINEKESDFRDRVNNISNDTCITNKKLNGNNDKGNG